MWQPNTCKDEAEIEEFTIIDEDGKMEIALCSQLDRIKIV